jgi:signal transduction histidine kinase/ligand-binding sensor domain-containing protein/DNA-binding response OmpR family regulator
MDLFSVNIRLSLLILLFFTGTAYGQFEPKNLIKHYSIKEGLSQAVVNSISEDEESLIWFATEDGLNRFDGYNFKVFKYDQQIRNGITDNFIQSLFRDRDGTLWISSRKGLLKFNPETETFSVFSHGFKNIKITTPNDVSFIAEGASKNLWIGWYGNGFASFDKTSSEFTPYNTSNTKTLSSDQTVALLEDKFGLLWVAAQNGGLNVFSVSNGRIGNKIDALSDVSILPSPNVRCLAEDNKGNIWIGTSKGLVVYLRQQNRFFSFDKLKNSLSGRSIFSLSVDSNENLWIGTQGSGIFRLDLRQFNTRSVDDLIFTQIRNLDDFDISKRTILSFYEDSSKNLWVGTFGDGVYMISNTKEKFIKIQKALYHESTFSLVPYYGMCYDHDGNLWLGTDGNGLYRKETYGNNEKHFAADGKPGSIGDNAILSAFCDSKGRLWFGTYSQGIYLYKKETQSFVHFKFKSNDASHAGGNDVRVIFEDSKKNLWAGTNRGGLCLIDLQSQTYGSLPEFGSVLRDGDVRAIAEDKAGNLWLGFYGDGLFRFNLKQKSLQPFFTEQDAGSKIQSQIVFALNYDRNGNLWIGTAGAGLFYYNEKEKKLKGFTEDDGLSNNTIYSILIDKNNNCWVSTNSGISRYQKDQNSFMNYESLDGLQDGQFNPGSGLYNYIGGYMCFGGTLGFNVFYPEQMDETSVNPKIMISGLQIFNKPVSIHDSIDDHPVLSRVINKTKQISLNHDQSVITIEFVGLNYSHPEKNNYAYKLDGLDEDWNFVGHQRSATYRYLKTGSYTFKVKASNQENKWGDDFASLSIVINPPFWQTPLAYGIYLVTTVALGWIFYRLGIKQLSLRKRLKIEKAQRKHEKRMAMEKLTFFTEISHEFRTPLTLIMGPLEEMLAKEEDSSPNGRKLKMVYRNANKLLSLINKLLDYRKIESGNVLLKIREDDIIPFVEEIFSTFKDLAVKKNINYTLSHEPAAIRVWFDKEKLEMVLNNIISNSFKYIGEGNEINISVSVQISEKYPQGRVVIKIRDNGIGIPKNQMGNIFDWFYKGDTSGLMNSGIGLSLARKLAHLHKGDIFVESSEGKGSTFSLKMPLGKDHFKSDEVVFITEEQIEAGVNPSNSILTTDADTESVHKRGADSLLIIEDDDEIRGFLKEYFEKDYKIIESGNGIEGRDLALNVHPDLIISDIMMPGMEGTEVCRQLKSNMRTSHIPLILLTAKTSLTHHKEGMEIGADAYITKPFSPEILSLTVNNLLQSRDNLIRFYRNLFMDQNGHSPNENDSPDEKFLHSIYDLLKSNLDKPDFNINELCEVLNMSRSLVYKKIKMLTGLSPVEYVRSLRMQEAAKLLKTQRYKVFEVVYMVGFSDLKYFRQCFAREFGSSPSDYMKQAELGNNNHE